MNKVRIIQQEAWFRRCARGVFAGWCGCGPGLRVDSTLGPVYMGACATWLTAPSYVPLIKALPQRATSSSQLPAVTATVSARAGVRAPSPASSLFPNPQGTVREWPVATEARLKYPSCLPTYPPPWSKPHVCFYARTLDYFITASIVPKSNVSINLNTMAT